MNETAIDGRKIRVKHRVALAVNRYRPILRIDLPRGIERAGELLHLYAPRIVPLARDEEFEKDRTVVG